ncbi:DEAD/DEAH box helicase family protein, partial [Prochlorococcus sp. AH-736-M13]
MNKSQFLFVINEFPDIGNTAAKVEEGALSDPRTACFYARRTIELLIEWIYEHDNTLRRPYASSLSNLIHAFDFRELVNDQLLWKFKLLKDLGNKAAHRKEPISKGTAVLAASELFQVLRWFALTYGRKSQDVIRLKFDKNLLPRIKDFKEKTQEQIKNLSLQLGQKDQELKDSQLKNTAYQKSLEILKKELAKIKQENQEKYGSEKDLTEFETRKQYIDIYLEEIGWQKYKNWTEEIEVKGMPNKTGLGYVDYVLWGDDGKPIGLIEAKKTTIDPKVGQQQAKLYADCLEKKYNQRPIIFLSNGFKHFIWDDLNYPRREVQGFYKKDELELLIRRRDIKKNLNNLKINQEITDRPYQQRAIRSITESLEKQRRKALLVMATGTGKTRTIISLCDLLIRCNWIKRVLFLADRKNLVSQAEKAFKKHLPDCSPVNLVKNKSGEGRIFLSTYPTISNLIDNQFESGKRRFGIGHFDLVIIDEAHRSVYKKYYSIFEYFDSLLIGLTATPKDEIDRNTYGLFDLDIGMPTDEYSYAEAIKDNFLTPFKGLSIPLKFVREGIKYDELSEEEKEEWEEIEWETEEVPEQIYSGQINKILFNSDTVDKVLKHLWEYGQRGEDPDRIGKTIIFAKNQKHAEFIEERFDKNFPHLKGHSLRVISHAEKYSETLIEEFSDVNNPLDIGVSIDMLDTGLDIPEI